MHRPTAAMLKLPQVIQLMLAMGLGTSTWRASATTNDTNTSTLTTTYTVTTSTITSDTATATTNTHTTTMTSGTETTTTSGTQTSGTNATTSGTQTTTTLSTQTTTTLSTQTTTTLSTQTTTTSGTETSTTLGKNATTFGTETTTTLGTETTTSGTATTATATTVQNTTQTTTTTMTTTTATTTTTQTETTTVTVTATTTTSAVPVEKITDITGQTGLQEWSVPVSVVRQKMLLTVDSSVIDDFVASSVVRNKFEEVQASIAGVLKQYVSSVLAKQSRRRLGGAVAKAEWRRLADSTVQADTTIVVPEDAMPAAGGAQELALRLASSLNQVDAGNMTQLINSALGADPAAQGFTVVVSRVEGAQPSIVDVIPESKFVCQAAGCSFSFYPEGQYWRYNTRSFTSLSECKRRCALTPECTGIERPNHGGECVFWLHSACDVTASPPGFDVWSDGTTCTKLAQYVQTESGAAPRTVSAFCSLLVALVLATFVAALCD